MKAAFGNGRVHDRCVCRHQHLEAFTVTRKIDPDLMLERSICTTKDKNMEQNSPFVQIVGFVRLSYDPVWMILMVFVTDNGVLIWRRMLTAARSEWWKGATGFAIPGSVFDPLPASAFDKPRSATDDAAALYRWFFCFLHFLFLIRKIYISPYAWSQGTAIIISAWYTSDVFPVSVVSAGERKWLVLFLFS